MNKVLFVIKSGFDFVVFFMFNILLNRGKLNNTWLISERGTDARDNGYWFYKYLKVKHPEVHVKYVISKNSVDYNKIDKEDIVKYRSISHYRYLFKAAVLISAEIMGFTPNERLYYRLNKKGLLHLRGKTVFLQHGITKDYFDYMKKENTKLDLFICGAKREYLFMRDKYGYDEDRLALTGFARFDQLNDERDKTIILIPTWRKWLRYCSTLKGTEFYDKYESLINDKEVIHALEESGYKMIYYPHPDMQKFAQDFYVDRTDVCSIVTARDVDMQDLLKRAELLVTDYSSVAFDMAYMGKKTIYFQFDRDRYRNEQYNEGYYSYEEDGFGPIGATVEEVKKHLLKFLSNSNKLREYNSRIEDFFGKRCSGNCERIYDSIIATIGGDKWQV